MIAPEASAAFVANMEDVLEVYQRPHDPKRPLVCLDETSKQLIAETRAPIAATPGQPERYDYEYERNGVANLFMMFAPLEGWRRVKVTDRRAALDYAHALKDLSDMHFPGADKIILVPRSPHLRQDGSDRRNRRLGKAPQHPACQGRLAIHNRRRPRQARKAIPSVRLTQATRRARRGPLSDYAWQSKQLSCLSGMGESVSCSSCFRGSTRLTRWPLGHEVAADEIGGRMMVCRLSGRDRRASAPATAAPFPCVRNVRSRDRRGAVKPEAQPDRHERYRRYVNAGDPAWELS